MWTPIQYIGKCGSGENILPFSFPSLNIKVVLKHFNINVIAKPIRLARQGPSYNSDFSCQVVHDCRNDSAALHFQYEVSIKNVFDTQVQQIKIYKYQISWQERWLPVTNEGLNIPEPILIIISHDCVSRYVSQGVTNQAILFCWASAKLQSSALSASFDCCSAE